MPSTLFRIATAGSVDDGKSTLIGRLLYDANAILSDQIESVSKISQKQGSLPDDAPIDLALITDGLRAEREQGITIDVAYRYFSTARRSFVLADCPGHEQYTRNTVTGASTADALVLLVDISKGILEQTRRHLAIASLLRVEHIIVAVNKIDRLDYKEQPFRHLETELQLALAELNERGQGTSSVATAPLVVPISALRGDNIVRKSKRTPWYKGDTLLSILERLPDADYVSRRAEPLRLPVQMAVRPDSDFRGYAGQIVSGSLMPGDEVLIQPGRHRATVTRVIRTELQKRLSLASDASVVRATAPESVVVQLAEQIDVARGSMISCPTSPATEVRKITAAVVWLDQHPLKEGAQILIKHGAMTVKSKVERITGHLSLPNLKTNPATHLTINDIGTVAITLSRDISVDDYSQSKLTGAIIILDPESGNTVGAGMISLPPTPIEPNAAQCRST